MQLFSNGCTLAKHHYQNEQVVPSYGGCLLCTTYKETRLQLHYLYFYHTYETTLLYKCASSIELLLDHDCVFTSFFNRGNISMYFGLFLVIHTFLCVVFIACDYMSCQC